MAAPENAITLSKEAETEWVGGPTKVLKSLVSCPCGFSGKLGDLLCNPDDETPNNFWCPVCKSKGWSWS